MDIDGEMLLAGICLVLFGFCIGMMVFFLIRCLLIPEEAYEPMKQPLSYQGDVRRTIGALQQLQVMIGLESAERDPSLADLVRLIRSVQRVFGRGASLEGVIQALVAQDIEQQLARRSSQPIESRPVVEIVQSPARKFLR